jgi:glycosyltransferase involved in cell wall biosynthesis
MSNLSTFTEVTDCSVVIPVYNEDAHTVVSLTTKLTMMGFEVIVVNDGDTVNLPDDITQVAYKPNMGYGYALKRGIEKATNSLVLTMDGDSQHTPKDALKLYTVFKLITNCDMLVGMRWNLKENFHRYFGRKVLNFIASLFANQYLIDLNSGMRIFKKQSAINYFPILCDEFSFTTSLTMSMICDGAKVVYFPIEVQPRLHGKSHVRVIRDGIVTLSYILYIGCAIRTRGIRKWLRNHGIHR